MKIQILALGKPREPFIVQGIEHYRTRLAPYLSIEWKFLPDPRKGGNLTPEQHKQVESDILLKHVAPQDTLLLLDENGRQLTSEGLEEQLYSLLVKAQKKIIFMVGGPYGASDTLKGRADLMISLSKMTFTHEMALLLLSEQLYRAAMIHSGSKYHHR